MQRTVNGRDVVEVLRAIAASALVAGTATAATGCESVFHWCLNGQYGAPYYAKSVREIPEDLRASVAGLTGGPLDPKVCRRLCNAPADACEIATVAEGSAPADGHVVCFAYRENGCPSGWGSGRLPDGLALDPRRATTLGDYFARAAALEAASVVSFRRLAADLARHGAPSALVRRAARAAHDEKRHATATRRLARRFGGERVRARLVDAAPRTLREIAVENAREGCVGETLGALLLFARAGASADAEVRATLRAIARDEIAHAALAWDLRAHLSTRLDARSVAAERRALDDARRAAKRVPVDPVFPFDPAPLVEALDAQLWRPALVSRSERSRLSPESSRPSRSALRGTRRAPR